MAEKKVEVDDRPAFPLPSEVGESHFGDPGAYPGMSLRDWFAGMVQADDRLVKSVRAMDDIDLAIFAKCPEAEADFTAIGEVEKYVKRFHLEAKSIARVRYIQADAMLAASKQKEG